MPSLRWLTLCSQAEGRDHISEASIPLGPSASWAQSCVWGKKKWSDCPAGDAVGLACFRFHDLHRGAPLPGMGPLHGTQRPVWEHAQPSRAQQSPVEEPVAQTAQKQWRRQPGPQRPRDRGRGADCGRRRRPLVPGPARCSARWLTASPRRGLWEGGRSGALADQRGPSLDVTQELLGVHPPPSHLPPSFSQVYRSLPSPQH